MGFKMVHLASETIHVPRCCGYVLQLMSPNFGSAGWIMSLSGNFDLDTGFVIISKIFALRDRSFCQLEEVPDYYPQIQRALNPVGRT